MTKRNWIIIASLFIGAMLSLLFFFFLYKASGGIFPFWIFFLIIPVVFLAIILLINLFLNRAKTNFYLLLQNKAFVIQKHYTWQNLIVCIDFNNKNFASNLLSIRTIVPFKDVRGCSVEITKRSEIQNIVSLVISIQQQGTAFDLFHISIFDEKINYFSDEEEINLDELVSNFPNLQKIISLRNDINDIIEINKADGVEVPVPTEDEFEQYLESASPHERFWE